MLEGYLPLNMLKRINGRVEDRYAAVTSTSEEYRLNHYFEHHDFRVAVGLTYLKELCKQMGVFSKIEPVLSFPLGTNVVSVAEVAKIYQTILHGKTFKYYDKGPPNQLNFIRRIEDRNGNILYQPQKQEYQLVKPSISAQMRQILRKVVTHGTGGRARGESYVEIQDPQNPKNLIPIRIPVFGKTGTTNDYRTASFAGFIPYPHAPNESLDPAHYSYVVASYVGYDLNKTMRLGLYRISGASGALPVWSAFARSIYQVKKYPDYFNMADTRSIKKQKWPLVPDPGTVKTTVDLARGLILSIQKTAKMRSMI